jgi:hypothetical protein
MHSLPNACKHGRSNRLASTQVKVHNSKKTVIPQTNWQRMPKMSRIPLLTKQTPHFKKNYGAIQSKKEGAGTETNNSRLRTKPPKNRSH